MSRMVGPMSKRKPASEHRGLAAEPLVFLEEGDVVASGRKRARRRQAAQSAADHANPRRFLNVHHDRDPS